jgi:hypothetical protein
MTGTERSDGRLASLAETALLVLLAIVLLRLISRTGAAGTMAQ